MHALDLAAVVAAHAVFLLAALGVGDRVITAAVFAVQRAEGSVASSRVDAERAAAALLAGLGTLALIGVVLAIVGVFGRVSLVAVGVVGLAAGRRRLRALTRALVPRRPQRRAHAIALAAIGVLMLVNYQAALAPPDTNDELVYHLPQARQIFDEGRLPASLPAFPGHPAHPLFGNIPKLGETLFAEGIAFGGYSLARLLHFSLFAASLLFCATRVRRLFGETAALAGALLILLFDELTGNATSAHVDAGVAAYEVAGAFAIAGFVVRRSAADAALGALFIGFALSIKYSAGLSAALAALAVAAAVLHRRLPWRMGAAIAAIGALPCAYWYAKNAVRFGNPTYPLLLGHEGAGEFQYEGAVAAIQSFVEPRTFQNLLRMPLHFFGEITTLHVLLALALLPLAFLARRSAREARLLAVYVAVYCTYWFFTTHQTRFLFAPVVVALWLLAGTGANASGRQRAVLAVAAAVVVALASPKLAKDASSNALAAAKAKLRTAEMRYTLGLADADAYLIRRFGCRYRAVQYTRSRPGTGTVVDNWTPFQETMLWLYDRRHRWLTFAPRGRTPEEYRAAANRRNIDYVYFRVPTRAAFLASEDVHLRAYRDVRMDAEELLLRDAELVWSDTDCRIYRVRRG